MKTLFTSDLHFHHSRILQYDNRPFDTVEEMDEAMTTYWNETVNDEDLVYILGDISWASPKATDDIFAKLKGRKVLIRGNHDSDKLLEYVGNRFEEITDYKEIYGFGNNRTVVLSHFPIVFFNHAHHGAIHFYGHVHNSWQWDATEGMRFAVEQKMQMKWNMINVGCMMPYVSYVPRTFEEITEGYAKWVSSK